jgi:quinol monooxygenase YgiN
MRLKPGMEDQLMAQLRQYEQLQVPGFVRTYIYRMDADPRDLYMAVIFASKAAYTANAQSLEQDARYRQMLDTLEGPPEWHDGEILAAPA